MPLFSRKEKPILLKVAETPPKITLVLGGGGARAFSQIGVIKVLQRENIPFNCVVGVSAGAFVGSYYANNPDPVYLEKAFLQAEQRKILQISLHRSLRGFVSGESFQKVIRAEIPHDDFTQLKIPLIAVAVDLTSGELVELCSGSIAAAVNASCALPPLFHPVIIGGRMLVDGGAIDPVPVNVAKRHGADFVIAVNVTQQLQPTVSDNLIGYYSRYNRLRLLSTSLMCCKEADVVIHPYVANTNLLDSRNRQTLIAEGEKAAEEKVDEIKQKLAEKNYRVG